MTLHLSKLKIVYSILGKNIFLTPDDLFSHFTVFLSLLSPNAISWSFCLVTLFFQALPTELQDAVKLGGYIFLDISKLTTSISQEHSLQTLREHAVVAFKKLSDESRRIRKIMSTMNTDRGSSTNTSFVQSHHSGSSAEQTIAAHSNPEAKVDERPLETKKDGKQYPRNPTNGYISRWPDGFHGCLGCGSDDHRFAMCPQRSNKDIRQLFWQELWAHVPTTRTKKSSDVHQSIHDSKPPSPSTITVNTNNIRTITQTNTRKRTEDGLTTHQDTQKTKEARWYAIFVYVNNVLSNPKKPMPIGINNSLPSVSLILGSREEEENKMRMLVDTGAAMNTGNIDFHLWVMSQCPDIVDEFLQCGTNTEYDVVHLLAALDIEDINKDSTHGQMTAVIRYKTPYFVTGKGPFVLSFALGHDVSLRSVLGLPTLLAMGANINLVKGLLSCVELNRDFPLDLQPPGKGLPEGAALTQYSPTVPTSVPSNMPLTTSLLHHTSSEGIPQHSLPTPSDNILVTDHFFHDTVTRDLSYIPTNVTSRSA